MFRRPDVSSAAPSGGAPLVPPGGERRHHRANREARNNNNIAQLLDIEGPSDIGKFTKFSECLVWKRTWKKLVVRSLRSQIWVTPVLMFCVMGQFTGYHFLARVRYWMCSFHCHQKNAGYGWQTNSVRFGRAILCVIHTIAIGIMLNFNGVKTDTGWKRCVCRDLYDFVLKFITLNLFCIFLQKLIS